MDQDWFLQVGMENGPAPWKATHSIYSMFLLNVGLTVANGVYWPAKPYHDDIDFPRLCEERGLAAAKCQWLFLHKVCQFASATVLLGLLVACCGISVLLVDIPMLHIRNTTNLPVLASCRALASELHLR